MLVWAPRCEIAWVDAWEPPNYHPGQDDNDDGNNDSHDDDDHHHPHDPGHHHNHVIIVSAIIMHYAGSGFINSRCDMT